MLSQPDKNCFLTVQNFQKREIGKAEELSLGYQGGIGAFSVMAPVYGVDLETLPELVLPHAAPNQKISAEKTARLYLAQPGTGKMSLAAAMACDVIKQKWRIQRPEIVRLWWGLEDAALKAVKNPGTLWTYNNVKFKVQDDFLIMRLPSGRCLFYRDPNPRVKIIPNTGKVVDGKLKGIEKEVPKP